MNPSWSYSSMAFSVMEPNEASFSKYPVTIAPPSAKADAASALSYSVPPALRDQRKFPSLSTRAMNTSALPIAFWVTGPNIASP